MLNFEAFSRYLNEEPELQSIELTGIGVNGKYIPQWAATLGMESEATQYQKIERLLAELNVAAIDDSVRLRILYKIRPTVQHMVGRLHQCYLNTPSFLTVQQQQQASQVSSLYYLLIIVYQGVINRSLIALESTKTNKLKMLIRLGSTPEQRLKFSIYEQMGLYVSLLGEAAILYKTPPDLYWKELNKLYVLSAEYNCSTTAIAKTEGHEKAETIEDYYCQACLLSLLKPATYRRQDIISMLKILNQWSKKVHITSSTDDNLKVFIDLDAAKAPEYLLASTETNPYAIDGNCVFVQLTPLLIQLQQDAQIDQAHLSPAQDNSQYNKKRLSKLALSSLQPKVKPATNLCNDQALLISGFSLIHYYIAGRSSLFNILKYSKILPKQRPTSNTTPKTTSDVHQLTVDITEIGKTSCRLFWNANLANNKKAEAVAANFNLQVQSLIAIKRIDKVKGEAGKKQDHVSTKHLNSLNPDILSRDTWELGIIRSMALLDQVIDIDVQIIGTSATACGIRLDNKDGRRQNFVPALLLAGDPQLGSKTSLIVPNYHFRSKDRVVLRVADKERLLNLGELLLKTDNIEQFTITRTAR